MHAQIGGCRGGSQNRKEGEESRLRVQSDNELMKFSDDRSDDGQGGVSILMLLTT